MNKSRVALPESQYLARIGEIAYTVSSMEWTLLGDLYRLGDEVAPFLVLKDLEPQTTGSIGACAVDAANKMDDGPVRQYIAASGEALTKAAKIRNDVLHARPATHPDQNQRLNRAEVKREGGKPVLAGLRFWISDEWLDEQVGRLNDLMKPVNEARVELEQSLPKQ